MINDERMLAHGQSHTLESPSDRKIFRGFQHFHTATWEWNFSWLAVHWPCLLVSALFIFAVVDVAIGRHYRRRRHHRGCRLVVVLSNPPAKINKNKCCRKNIMKLITVYIFMFSQATRCCFQFFIICLYLNFECLAIFQMLGIARFDFKWPNNQFFMHNDHPNTRRSRKKARFIQHRN